MEILKVLTKRNLKLNKKRTIVTIIGITLSTALIVCVAGMVTSFQKTLIHSAIQQYGNYHVQIRDMDRNDALALEENRDVKSYSFISSVGYSKLKNPQNEYKPYIFVTSFDEKALSSLGLHLLDGRLPENENEIVLSEHLLTKENLNVSIGDTLSLSIGKRYVSAGVIENEASQENAFEPEISESLKEEQVHNYKVVGIVERPNYSIEDYSAPGYTCITFKESYEEKQDAFLLYKDAKGYSKKTKNIASEKYGYQYNSELLRWLGVSESETMYALYAVAGIVITIIIVSSVFVIKNSFDISITEKFKMYGMFRSVGATSKQIKRNVLYEGFLLGCIAIPCGILCGIIAILILIFLINVILGDFLNGVKFVYSLPLLPIVLTIVLASVTICFSTFFAAKRAGKIFPIEAIRSNNDVKIKRKELHTPKWVKGLFNTGGVIAYKNLKRNKKSIVQPLFLWSLVSLFLSLYFLLLNMDLKCLIFIIRIWDLI